MLANGLMHGFLSLVNQVAPMKWDELWIHNPPFVWPRKVLVVPSRFIGDAILMTPFLQNLAVLSARGGKEAFEVHLLATRTTACLFEGFPGVSRVILESFGSSSAGLTDFLRVEEYDTVFFCRYAPYLERAAVRAGVAQRVGFDLARLGVRGLNRHANHLTHTIPSTSLKDLRPQVEIYLDILRWLGFQEQVSLINDKRLFCPLEERDYQEALSLLVEGGATLSPTQTGPRVLIHATAGSPGKCWPWEYWASLLKHLYAGWQTAVFAVGTEKEAPYYNTLAEDSGVPIAVLCGKTSVRQSIALLGMMDLVITLDTSVAHMAAAAKTPRMIVLYGPTNASKWVPWAEAETFLQQIQHPLPCQPCLARTCATKPCIRKLTVEKVLEAVERSFQWHPFLY